MAPTEQTERLILRVPKLSDANDLMDVFGDRDAMRYTFHLPTLRDCRRRIAGNHCQRRRKGFGPWTIVEKASGRIIGFGGLLDDPFDPGWGVEVAYHFSRAAWGKGYATELAKYSLDVAAPRLRVSHISAFAHPDNVGSQRVLAKVGFVRQRFVPEMNRFLYARSLAGQA